MSSVKIDPTLLEEQDDLLMSYLNSDYLSSDNTHWPMDASTPESTSSSEQTHVISPSTSPESTCNESFEIAPKEDTVNWPLPNYILGESGCLEPDLLSGFPFLIQQQSLGPNVVYSAIPPVSQQSSVENEQLKRKRERSRKQSSSSATAATSPVSITNPIAPQGLKSLATLRPASPVKLEAMTPVQQHDNTPVDDQKMAAIAKRQERLIKNRAAALLSRKRKREHLTALEEQKRELQLENENLLKRLERLENEKNSLNNENQELKDQLSLYESKYKVTPMSSMVLMIILFSFAILAFPAKSSRLPLINPSATTFQLSRYCSQTNDCKTKDESKDTPFLIKTVNGKNLEKSIQEEDSEGDTVRLYSDQIVQLQQQNKEVVSKSVSLMCPYEQETQRFLQIDMQVVRSRLVHGEFKIESDTLLEQQHQSIKRRRLNG
ncbi:hypothetical protein K501DRAFT_329554 [Backusella circina FSU 941]|nr:hypothetical protein K501DRAFT_329554 [Backusella circina FSU 941]